MVTWVRTVNKWKNCHVVNGLKQCTPILRTQCSHGVIASRDCKQIDES
jgi:hypothetical protein